MPSRLPPDRFPAHDAEITGFGHDAQKAELRLECRAASGAQHALVFSGVKAWRLSEFQAQNVLFDVSEYTGSDWLESDEGRDEYYAELNDSITASDAVFLLESSVGLDGAVVAKSWRIDALGSPEPSGELSKLQEWYDAQCNGDREHQYGIRIGTFDNPGWWLDVDLSETSLTDKVFSAIAIERSDADWVHCKVEGVVFKARGGTRNLTEMVGLFLAWSLRE